MAIKSVSKDSYMSAGVHTNMQSGLTYDIMEELSERIDSVQKDIADLKVRKRWDTSFSGAMGLIGGILAVIGQQLLKKFGIY